MVATMAAAGGPVREAAAMAVAAAVATVVAVVMAVATVKAADHREARRVVGYTRRAMRVMQALELRLAVVRAPDQALLQLARRFGRTHCLQEPVAQSHGE